jgi:hypothetical protein
MKSKIIAALLLATSATLAAPAFASGIGPAPFYRPDVGAPSSQSGPSERTIAAEQGIAVTDVGGVAARGESGGSRVADIGGQSSIDNLYRGH